MLVAVTPGVLALLPELGFEGPPPAMISATIAAVAAMASGGLLRLLISLLLGRVARPTGARGSALVSIRSPSDVSNTNPERRDHVELLNRVVLRSRDANDR